MKHYFYKIKLIALATTVCSVLSVTCLAAIPMLHKKLFDTPPKEWDINSLLFLICLYGLAFILCCCFEYLSQRAAWHLDWKLHIMLRTDLYKGIIKKSVVDFKSIGVGEYLSRFQNDVDVVTAYINSGINSLKYILQIAVYFAFIVTLDWRILLIIIFGTIIALLIPRFTGRELSDRKTLWTRKKGTYLDAVEDLFNGFEENNYKTEENLKKYHDNHLFDTENSMLKFGRFSSLVHVINGGILYAINILCFSSVGILYFTSAITSGTGVAALGYVNSFIDPLRYLLEEISSMKASRGVANDLIKLIEDDSKKPRSSDCLAKVNKLELKNINKKLGDFEINNVNISFEKGKRYAMIGPNGSGKSSLLKIIRGTERADSGAVLFDGCRMENMDARDTVFLMESSSHIFNSNIMDNITVFDSYNLKENNRGFTKSICNELHKKANKCSSATMLSSGEKENIMFMRAVLSDFPVILLDEPFSAMDKKNAHRLKKILKDLDDKVIITITHDLSKENLEEFDTVIGIKAGKIEICGTPQEVIYSNFYKEISK